MRGLGRWLLLVTAALFAPVLTCAGAVGAATVHGPAKATTTATTVAPSAATGESAAELTRCGLDRGQATYHGTNAGRDLRRAIPDPLKVVNVPCNFPATIRGIRIDPQAVSLVAGGQVVRIIPVPAGPMTIPQLTLLIDDPSWISQVSPGVFDLKASLIQEVGTSLEVAAPQVTELLVNNGQAVAIGGSGAVANFDGVTVESWNPVKHVPIATPVAGRPFVLYENDSQLNISHSTMEYLGSDVTSSYGVSWRVGGTYGTVDHSIFQHNFFGAYTFQAANVTFENSTFRYNTFYGIDPHTNSTDLTIKDNNVYGNRDHGIVFSRYVTNSVVTDNYVHGNKNNGIMMDFHSDGNTVSHNVVTGNSQGIVLSGSASDNVFGNRVSNNQVGIRASHQGADLDNIHNNQISGGEIGIQLYGGATTSMVTGNVIEGPASTGMVLDAPRSVVRANRISGTPTGMKVMTATMVAGGSVSAQKTGVEVGSEGVAIIRSVAVHAAEPLSHVAGSSIQLINTSFHLPSPGSSITGFDVAGVLIILFAIMCEVIHLARGRSVKRLALAFDGTPPTTALLERPVSRLSGLSVRVHSPPAPESPPHDHAVSNPEDPVRRFRPDIEGLRALAVVSVVVCHASLGLSGGYVGVDIFFVISGFLITRQLLRERDRAGRTSFVQFYARRVRRILPAAALVTCTTLIASYFLLSPLRLASVAKDAAAAALFSVNWRLAAAGTNYFNASAPPSPFQHYWSLSVEEQFYFVWPLLIVAVAFLCRKRVGLQWPLTVALGVIAAASLWESIHVTGQSASFAYFGTHTRAWELAVGALLAVWATKLASVPRVVAFVLAWVGIGAMVWAAVTLDGSTPYPGWIAQVPVYGAALVIAAGCGMAVRGGPEFLLKKSPFQSTGRISYSLYLWHWPLLILLPYFLGHTPSWQDRLSAVLIAVILSIATYVLVEQPVRNSAWMVRRPSRALGIGALLIALCLIVALFVGSSKQIATSSSGPATTPELSAAITRASSPKAESASDAVLKSLQAAAHVQSVPSDLTPPLGTAATNFPATTGGCEVSESAIAPTLPCNQFGDVTGKTQVVLVGDSHAGMWLPAVEELAQQNQWRLTFLAKSGCAIGDYPDLVDADYADRVYTECNQWRSAVIAHIVDLRPAVIIVASQARSIAAKEPNGLTKSLDQLAKSSAKIVFLADTPNPTANVPDCLAEHLADVPACDIPVASSGIRSPGRLAEIAGAQAAGAAVIDPTSWLCTSKVCPVIVQDTLVYMDASHITGSYALLREPQLAAAVNSAVAGS